MVRGPMATVRPLLLLAPALPWLAGCGAAEPGPLALGYCYRTLAEVDCYTTPEPNRQPLGLVVGPPVVVYGREAEGKEARDEQD